MFEDHAGDVSSSEKSIDLLGVLLFHVHFLLELRSWRPVSRSWDNVSLWMSSTFSTRQHSELPQFLEATTLHQMDGKTRNTRRFFLFEKYTANCCKVQVWDNSRIPICPFICSKHHTVTFLEAHVELLGGSRGGGKITFDKLLGDC